MVKTGFDNTTLAAGCRSAKRIVSESFKDIGRTIGASFVGGAVVAGINSLLSHFDELKKKADNLVVGTDFFQGMKEIADDRIVGGIDTVTASLNKLNLKLGEAKDGNQETIDTFKKYGITIGDIASMNTEEIFYKIADAVKGIPDPAMRAHAVFELLGKSGTKMTSVMSEGGDAIRKMINEVDKLDTKKIQELADAKHNFDDVFDTAMIKSGKFLGFLIHDIPEALGKMTTGLETVRAASKEKAHQEMVAQLKAITDKFNTAEQAEEDAIKKTADARKKSDEERIKKADQAYDAMVKNFGDEEDRLRQIAWLKKSNAVLDEKSVEFHEQRLELIKLESEQEKLAESRRRAAAENERIAQDYQKGIREKISKVTEGTIPTVESLAGSGFSKRLNDMYGEGGVYDLSKGDGPMAKIAQKLMLSQKQAQFDFTYGNKGAYETDLKNIHDAKNQLMDLGVIPDTRDMRNISENTKNAEKHLASLWDAFEKGTAATTIKIPQ